MKSIINMTESNLHVDGNLWAQVRPSQLKFTKYHFDNVSKQEGQQLKAILG